MKQGLVRLSIPLSQLLPSKHNPRKVKPSREADETLMALIRSQGLLQPLVVRRLDAKHYEVVAGSRRLRALRKIHQNDGDPKIDCVARDVDDASAYAMSLAENVGRAAMHPLDEAEGFAKLATRDGKDAEAIAAEFGVEVRYVRQRMKLATLAKVVKEAYRKGAIDTAIAEAFAAVPEDRQLEIWNETGGHPRHAEHVRNVIANAWIDAKHALFDVSILSDSAVSRDLFGDRVLVERQADMDAQTQALDAQRQALGEEGWKEVVIGKREDVQDRLYAMHTPEREFDASTSQKLAQLADRQKKLEAAAKRIGHRDERKLQQLQRRYDKLESQEQEIVSKAPEHVSEETKAIATSFLILDPDGRVHREVRVPRRKHDTSNGKSGGAADGAGEKPEPPMSDDLSDKQLAVTFTHQALAVREALLKNNAARKRILALMLHEKVRSEALAVRHEANGTTLHATSEGFNSAVFNRLREKRTKLDPFAKEHFVEDRLGYKQLAKLSASKLDSLIDLLIVECITAHMQRRTELVHHLATELKVNIRDDWRPDAGWLSSFQKIQLAHLITELKGLVHAPAPERKKSELVASLGKLFAEAAEGKLEDKQLVERTNRWLPSNLREENEDTSKD